ncbi:MAG: hypothetical protein ACETVN_01215 [Asgard group archaeon]
MSLSDIANISIILSAYKYLATDIYLLQLVSFVLGAVLGAVLTYGAVFLQRWWNKKDLIKGTLEALLNETNDNVSILEVHIVNWKTLYLGLIDEALYDSFEERCTWFFAIGI